MDSCVALHDLVNGRMEVGADDEGGVGRKTKQRKVRVAARREDCYKRDRCPDVVDRL